MFLLWQVALATYGLIGVIVLYNMIKPSKKEVKSIH